MIMKLLANYKENVEFNGLDLNQVFAAPPQIKDSKVESPCKSFSNALNQLEILKKTMNQQIKIFVITIYLIV